MHPCFNEHFTNKLVCLVSRDVGDDKLLLQLQAIEDSVLRGANVMASFLPSTVDRDIDDDDADSEEVEDQTVLHYLIHSDQLEAVKICLQSPIPLNFTITTTEENSITALHAALLVRSREGVEYNRLVVRAIVERIIQSPADRIDWGQTCCIDYNEYDFLSLAAHNQLLSVVWPEVQCVPYFSDRTDPFVLTGEVYEWDLCALGDAAQLFSVHSCAMLISVDSMTGKLWREIRPRQPFQTFHNVERLVAGGADIMWLCGRCFTRPLLLEAMDIGDVELVEALLRTPNGIDFRVGDRDHSTAAFFVVGPASTSEKVATLIRLLHKRHIEQQTRHMNSDVSMDWGFVNRLGVDPLSNAASWGYLSDFFRTVYDELRIPYFVDALQKEGSVLEIRCKVRQSDWQRIPLRDQQRMVLHKGLVMDSEAQIFC